MPYMKKNRIKNTDQREGQLDWSLRIRSEEVLAFSVSLAFRYRTYRICCRSQLISASLFTSSPSYKPYLKPENLLSVGPGLLRQPLHLLLGLCSLLFLLHQLSVHHLQAKRIHYSRNKQSLVLKGQYTVKKEKCFCTLAGYCLTYDG